jgi:TfoX/Sxy family transcriptional regulator of competence genes
VAYDEDLADRIRNLLSGETVVEKKMFGGLAFLVGGNMSVAASGQGGLMVRIDPDQTEALLKAPGAGEFEMGNRGPMKGWLRVDADAVRDDAALSSWVTRGVEHARTLPPKGRR